MKIRNIDLYFTLFILFFTWQQQAQCSLLDAGEDVPVNCANTTATLEAKVFEGLNALTDTYEVSLNTPCPLPPSGSTTPTGITDDDVWSDVIDLPFTFYFFGQPYTQVIIGANGVLSFDLNNNNPIQSPTQFCAYAFDESLPSPNLFHNTIFGAYHDVDVRAGGKIEYYVSGVYPERKFVVSYINVAHYQCNNLKTTQRIVLYETSNVIDVQIDRKDTCTGWNNGNAVVGIQNEAGDVAYVPLGRNTGPWTVPPDSPELWRFVPNANPQSVNFDFKWYDDNNNLISNSSTVTVDTTIDRVYYVTVDFDNPVDGQHYHLEDDVTVYFEDILGQPDLGDDFDMCSGTTATLDATVDNGVDYQWQKDGVDIPGATNPVLEITDGGEYSVTVVNGVCKKSDEVKVTLIESPLVSLVPDFHECEGNIATLTADVLNLSGSETYQWQKDNVDIPGATNPSLDVTETGTYSVVVTNNTTGCIGTDQVNVTFDEYPELELGDNQILCSYQNIEVHSNIEDADYYEWRVNGQVVSNNSSDLEISEPPGLYEVELTLNRGTCTVTDVVNVQVLDPIAITPVPVLYGKLNVEVSGGLPPYQYSLNGDDFQDEPSFADLPDGEYTVYVKDANNCTYKFTEIHVTNLIFNRFFTPNGDGYNDTWRVTNAENTPEARLYIYDRYGKLIKQMNTNINEFWDGTYNGIPAPSTDYWFMLVLPDGQTFKGHFALKR